MVADEREVMYQEYGDGGLDIAGSCVSTMENPCFCLLNSDHLVGLILTDIPRPRYIFTRSDGRSPLHIVQPQDTYP